MKYLNFFTGIGSSLFKSALADLGAIVFEPIEASKRTVKNLDDLSSIIPNILSIPVSPLLAQQAIGNKGFERIRTTSRLAISNRWIEEETINFLKNDANLFDSKYFRDMSERLDPSYRFPGNGFQLFDASRVYNGVIGKESYQFLNVFALGPLMNQLLPGEAHGDIRRYDKVQRVSKRERTFNFVYNFTRSK